MVLGMSSSRLFRTSVVRFILIKYVLSFACVIICSGDRLSGGAFVLSSHVKHKVVHEKWLGKISFRPEREDWPLIRRSYQ